MIELIRNFDHMVDEVQLEISGYLIVTRATRTYRTTDIAQLLFEAAFQGRMDIFIRTLWSKFSGGNFFLQILQSAQQFLGDIVRNNLVLLENINMRD